MNDKLCLEHGLSVVENPKPSRDHYGTWLGDKKQPSFQEQLRRAIDAALEEKPKDFSEFLKKLEAARIEVNQVRKHLRFRVPGQKNYSWCDTLKGDYTEQAIKERIKGTRTVTPRRTFAAKQIVSYARTRVIYVEYRKAGYSKNFRAGHEADIMIHQAAKKYFDGQGITKLPSVKVLREEYAGLRLRPWCCRAFPGRPSFGWST
ncbi:hypothetical protein CE91St63_06080 [[Clostridium] hylemonae]|uniref:relaxase/mobilization nuclease domain-containing protein n=1 Tax=[Clostridium] hylemonae TaxID=89153 RepID=UPI002ED1E67B|nr:hypothetical protein CE91St63_06080 [[Clostridium] hylemonae]